MSLFGGDGAYDTGLSQTSNFPPISTSPNPADTSSRTAVASEDVQDAQRVTYNTYDVDDENDEDYVDESDEGHHPAEVSRPNRFTGKASTWRHYTAADRKIADSLDRLQARNLSAHLYNAYALKRRVRLPREELHKLRNWQGKESWLKKGAELMFTDIAGDTQTELVPSKRWTAWPLPAGVKQDDRGEGDNTPAPEGLEGQYAGTNLREEVLAVFLKLAKEKFMCRETDDDEVVEAESRARSRSVKRSKSVTPVGSELSAAESDHEMSESESKWANIIGTGKEAKDSQAPSLKPTVLADDEYAFRILEPSINSILARIDRLSEGIRRTRANHFGRGAHSDTSGSEAISDVESLRSSSRSLSRSRSRSAPAKRRPTRAASRSACAKLKSLPKPQDGNDSASDYGVETGPEGGDGAEDMTPELPKRKRGGSTSSRDSSVVSTNREASGQTGLMDWSEVLGIASMGGWNHSVIARTAARCASLFDESLEFRSLGEDVTSKPSWQSVQYTPSTDPAPDLLENATKPHKRPFFETGTLRCPHTDCRGHNEDFAIPYRVIEHVQRVHGYDPRTNDSDNEDRKAGGVHKDGFLQPVTAKQGWIGAGRTKSKSTGPTRPRRNKRVKQEAGTAIPEHDSV